ncbi:DUF6702 family protein [Riemerella columbina]|uniref:DUF6702 family protein n=1 Tax=Riemerella columbina TaxID=103810 RepID=UPI0003818A85|nr:DUF6702 family protein [Riemerella columbina]
MKKFLSIFGILSLLALFSFGVQDFYSTMTKVDYVDGSNTLKFTTKMNASHISKAVKIDPRTAAFEAEVKKYVNSKVSVSINGKPQNITFTGSQVNGESVWVYYEINDIPSISTLKIRNAILMEIFPKQLNLVNISYKGNQQNMNFTKGNDTSEVSF